MKLKRIFAVIPVICIFLFSGCSTDNFVSDETQSAFDTDAITEATTDSYIEVKPTSNDELFEYIISKWRQNGTADLYEYAGDELNTLLNKNDFTYLFDSVSKIGGELKDIYDKQSSVPDAGIVTYNAKLNFENITAEVSISFRNLKICSFVRNVYFKSTFEIDHGNGIKEKYFTLKNDGFNLNSVYTYVDDGKAHPAALLIAGSGPSDYNETVGLLTPFEDIALGLARNGINSLRVDKRTLNYASEFSIQSGIEEEYISDCNAAVEYLKLQKNSGLYLLGHSLGGQIAVELASKNNDIDGIIIFNSSARHLADITSDQYTALDPSNKDSYIAYADAAKNVTAYEAKGNYCYGVSDYYWASYNKLDTLKNISEVNSKILIINSKFDKQIFEEDINLWETFSVGNKNILISVYDDISHFGYKTDTSDPSSLYKRTDFPTELISAFSYFITEKN